MYSNLNISVCASVCFSILSFMNSIFTLMKKWRKRLLSFHKMTQWGFLFFFKWGCPTLSLASGLRIICARCAMAPLSTTVWASSGECLEMSLRVEAAMRLTAISGSRRQNTSRGTAPASTTDWANAAQRRTQASSEHVSRCEGEREWSYRGHKMFLQEMPEGIHRDPNMSVCLTYTHCDVRCSLKPRQQPPSPRGQTPPGRGPERRLPHSPPQPGTARGSVWPPHAAQTLLPSYRTSGCKQIPTQRIRPTTDNLVISVSDFMKNLLVMLSVRWYFFPLITNYLFKNLMDHRGFPEVLTLHDYLSSFHV